MTVRPQGVLACRRPRRIDEGLLGHQHEGALGVASGGDLGLTDRNLRCGPPDMHGSGETAVFVGPWHLFVERVIDLNAPGRGETCEAAGDIRRGAGRRQCVRSPPASRRTGPLATAGNSSKASTRCVRSRCALRARADASPGHRRPPDPPPHRPADGVAVANNTSPMLDVNGAERGRNEYAAHLRATPGSALPTTGREGGSRRSVPEGRRAAPQDGVETAGTGRISIGEARPSGLQACRHGAATSRRR